MEKPELLLDLTYSRSVPRHVYLAEAGTDVVGHSNKFTVFRMVVAEIVRLL